MLTTGSEAKVRACELLRFLAVRTWSDIRDGEAASIRIGEESITDRLLLDLARFFPHPTVVKKWNRRQEARETGADWDWWFIDPWRGVGVGLRIQAKRIDYPRERISGLEHENRHGLQRLTLQRSAVKEGLHPLYCFYLATGRQLTGPTACGSFASDESPPGWSGPSQEIYGCSLVGPAVVEHATGTGDYGLGSFWPFLLPWSCLACCESAEGGQVGRIDWQAVRIGAMSPSDSTVVRSPGQLLRPLSKLPPEVLLIAEGEGPDDDLDPSPVGATAVTMVDEVS